MTRLTLAFSLLLAGCAPGPTLPVVLYTEDEPKPLAELPQAVEEAGIMAGIYLEADQDERDMRGKIVLELLEVEGQVSARMVPFGPCFRHIRAPLDSRVIAHELGHAMDLPDVKGPEDRLMLHRGGDGTRLTHKEARKIARRADLFSACR